MAAVPLATHNGRDAEVKWLAAVNLWTVLFVLGLRFSFSGSDVAVGFCAILLGGTAWAGKGSASLKAFVVTFVFVVIVTVVVYTSRGSEFISLFNGAGLTLISWRLAALYGVKSSLSWPVSLILASVLAQLCEPGVGTLEGAASGVERLLHGTAVNLFVVGIGIACAQIVCKRSRSSGKLSA